MGKEMGGYEQEGRWEDWEESPGRKGKGQISHWQIQGVEDERNNWEGSFRHR